MSKEIRMSMEEMKHYRERLMQQKEFLTNILSKVDKQILALQVERLHLKNNLLGTGYSNETVPNASVKNTNMKTQDESMTKDPENLLEQELDLTVSLYRSNSEEESEEEKLTDINDIFKS